MKLWWAGSAGLTGRSTVSKGKSSKQERIICGVVMAGDADETHQALFPGLGKCLDGTAWSEDFRHVILGPDVMHLPQIEVVGVHVTEGLVQVGQGACFTAVVRLAGKKDLASPLPQCLAVV